MASLEHKRNSQAQDYRPSLYTYENGFYYDCTTCFISQCHMHQQCEKREKKGRVRYVWIVLLSVKHGGGQQQRCYVTAGGSNIKSKTMTKNSTFVLKLLKLSSISSRIKWIRYLNVQYQQTIIGFFVFHFKSNVKRFEMNISYWFGFGENMLNFLLNCTISLHFSALEW